MNHLLLREAELDANQEFCVSGERSQHLRQVLGVAPGRQVRAACLNHSIGSAEVLSNESLVVRLRYTPDIEMARPAPKLLLLAMPRPKVLSRCIQHAAALGFTRIVLFRSYRVEKSQLDSTRLAPERLEADAFVGLEQARLVHMPEFEVFLRFRPFVEDHLPQRITGMRTYLAHPNAPRSTLELPVSNERYGLVLGPEGGFVDFELQLLEAQGCFTVRGPDTPLRVESALSYFAGQFDWLHGPRARDSADPPPSLSGAIR